MKAAVFEGIDVPLSLLDLDTPALHPGQVMMAVRYAGICGTDLHASREAGFGLKPGTVMGHEFSGVVVESRNERIPAGAGIVAFPIVVCDECRPAGACRRNLGMSCPRSSIIGLSQAHPGGFSELVSLDADNAIVVDGTIDMKVAALAEPFAVAVHALKSAGTVTGRHVAILGGGPIGLATAMIARDLGASFVSLSEPAPARREIAASIGAGGVLDPRQMSPGEMRRHLKSVHSTPSVVVDCAGVRGSFSTSIELVEARGTVVIVGICSSEDSFHPAQAINKAITTSFVLGYDREDFSTALDLLVRKPDLAEKIITNTIRLADAPAVIYRPGEHGERGKVMVDLLEFRQG